MGVVIVLHHYQLVGPAIDTHLDQRGVTVGEQARFERRIGPGVGHHSRAGQRRAAVHVFDLAAHLLGAQQAFVDQQFAYRYLELAPIAEGIVEVGARRTVGRAVVLMTMMIVIVVIDAHVSSSSHTACSQCW